MYRYVCAEKLISGYRTNELTNINEHIGVRRVSNQEPTPARAFGLIFPRILERGGDFCDSLNPNILKTKKKYHYLYMETSSLGVFLDKMISRSRRG